MLKQTILEAIQAGGVELKRFFNSNFKISHKEGVNNLVTQAETPSINAMPPR